jgi:AdoMet-dependent rRNA methyltransferase SPB1
MRVLAKRMLRKKDRTEVLDSTYNRYSFHDDVHTLPSWFVEDESKHYFRHVNPTKEEVALEKEELKAYNARPSKKVEEAKARKKKRLQKAMQKVKAKAQVIAEQDINEQAKMKQIQKMYSKEKSKHQEKKEYVFNKKFSSVQGRKAGRNVKMVDPRLKKDLIKQKKAGKGVRGYAKKGHSKKR